MAKKVDYKELKKLRRLFRGFREYYVTRSYTLGDYTADVACYKNDVGVTKSSYLTVYDADEAFEVSKVYENHWSDFECYPEFEALAALTVIEKNIIKNDGVFVFGDLPGELQ